MTALSRLSEVFNLLGLIAGYQSVYYLVYLSVQKPVQLIYRHTYPVVCDSALRKVVRPYPLASVTGTYLTPSLSGDFIVLFLKLEVVQSGSENFKRFLFILDL